MLSFAMMDDGYFAKLYVLPERTMLDYHKEIIGIIVKSLGVAVSNFLNIKRLENDAIIDPMTDCYNRRAFDRMIQHNIHNAHRYNRDLSVIMLDLDRFKSINDLYGHPAGDKVLIETARLILSAIRKSDYVVRYGGEEFVVVLPETNLSKAMELAERLRRLIGSSSIQIAKGKEISVTASFGVAALTENSDAEGLLSEADTMLYRAKASGRNKVMPGAKLFVLEAGQSGSMAQAHL
jgi:diguanylate cyclase (GGDEF)-like protein